MTPERQQILVGMDGLVHRLVVPFGPYIDGCSCGWRSTQPDWDRTHGREILEGLMAALEDEAEDWRFVAIEQWMAVTRKQLAGDPAELKRLIDRMNRL